LPVPVDLQGRVPEEIYQGEFLQKNPVRKAAAGTSGVGVQESAPVPGEVEDEETVLERLRELGYIE
ncbi:MAG TPA: hypothetical protein VMT86_08050, partial [Bryobacteraceae bacterium]|nr:hypothetical protein [Bryobacteraceae bacterium]